MTTRAEGKRLRDALNTRQAKFAQNYANGSTGKAAAIAAGYSPKSAEVSASGLIRNLKVSEYIDFLRGSDETEATLTRQRKREILKELAEGRKGTKPADRLTAIRIDNDMTGDCKPVRIEGEITLHTIMQSLAPSTGLPAEEL